MSTYLIFNVEAAELARARHHCEHPHHDPLQHSWTIPAPRPIDGYVTGTPQQLYAAGCRLIALALQQEGFTP
jgi:hypothetical protein